MYSGELISIELVELIHISFKFIISSYKIYSDRQKYEINSLKIKLFFFKKIFGQVNFSL
jgi:hypothetical protein